MNFIIFVSFRFRNNLLAANQLIIREFQFDTEEKSPIFVFEIMTTVPSANNAGYYTELILRGRPLIYIMNKKGPRIDP